MYILGLHNDEDSGVALLKNGQILDVINEERLNRTKLFQGFPKMALAHVLKKNNLTLDDIDVFAYGWHGRQNDYRDYARKLTRRIIRAMDHNPDAGPILDQRVTVEMDRDQETRASFEIWLDENAIPADKVVWLDHHSSHSWGAFALSPFDKALVFTFDGRGDLKSTTVSVAEKDKGIEEQHYLLSMDSLGFLYGQITWYLGYKPHRHEGKVTGLAARGNAATTLPLFEELVTFENGDIIANIGPYKPFYTNMEPELIARFDAFDPEDIAAGLQTHCENLVTKFVSWWKEKINRPDIVNICLAGGVAANVCINQKIAELPGIESVFVFPHMGDGGLPLGSACHALYEKTGQAAVDYDHVYWGPEWSDDQIGQILDGYGDRVTAVRCDDIVASTVSDLRNDKVIGWFEGRMEMGPRALGARSIIYHTRDGSVNDWLNKRMNRTEFMPFAPVTPIEYASECYLDWKDTDQCTPFMTKTFDCTPAFSDLHKAVVHIDGTARPQVVTAERNKNYYQVVKAYCDQTGERALINTSFNAHEEPIVCSPEDAINSMISGVIDVLAIGSWRVTTGAAA